MPTRSDEDELRFWKRRVSRATFTEGEKSDLRDLKIRVDRLERALERMIERGDQP